MANDKPKITATIKFRGVTIEGVTVEELRELRDVLNQLVGERVVERREYVPYYPWHPTWITTTGTWTINSDASNTLRLDGSALSAYAGDCAHLTLTCN